MAFELDGFSDAVLSALSHIGIEFNGWKHNNDPKKEVPKAIYEISKINTNKGSKPTNKPT